MGCDQEAFSLFLLLSLFLSPVQSLSVDGKEDGKEEEEIMSE